MRRGSRRVPRPWLPLAVALLVHASGVPAIAQTPDSRTRSTLPARVGVGLAPDTVRIGEPFVLAIMVRPEAAWRPSFPAVLDLGRGFEQRAAPEVRQPSPDEWRAYYRLVAWETDPGDLPSLELELVTDGELLTVPLRPPPITVASVLPEDATRLELRPARPFLERTGRPWLLWLLAALAVLALVVWWLARRRRREGKAEVKLERPVERALRELEELRRGVEAGRLAGAPFYDRLEDSLRRYAEATRGWSPGTLINRLPNGNRELAVVLRRSTMMRFGRLELRGDGAGAALDVCRIWLEAERELVAEEPGAGSAEGGGA